LSELRRLNYHN